MAKFLSSNSTNEGGFAGFTNDCVALKFKHPLNERLQYTRYLHGLKQKIADNMTQSQIDQYVKDNCV